MVVRKTVMIEVTESESIDIEIAHLEEAIKDRRFEIRDKEYSIRELEQKIEELKIKQKVSE